VQPDKRERQKGKHPREKDEKRNGKVHAIENRTVTTVTPPSFRKRPFTIKKEKTKGETPQRER
jgi:hypothetical protein